jgi:hypothetical protein
MKDPFSKYIYWYAGNKEYYKLSSKTRNYINVNDSDRYFPNQKIFKWKHQFLFGESIEDIEQQLEKIRFENIYGNGLKGNCQCPNCNRYFDLSFENSEGYLEEKEIYVKCLCGELTKFKSIFKIQISN